MLGMLFLGHNAVQADLVYGVGLTGADRAVTETDESGTTGTLQIDPSKVYGVNLYLASTENPSFSYKIGYLTGTQRYKIAGVGGQRTAKYTDILLSAVYDIAHSKSGWFLDAELGVSIKKMDGGDFKYDNPNAAVYGVGVGKMFFDKMFLRISTNGTTSKYKYLSQKSGDIGTLQFDLTYWFI